MDTTFASVRFFDRIIFSGPRSEADQLAGALCAEVVDYTHLDPPYGEWVIFTDYGMAAHPDKETALIIRAILGGEMILNKNGNAALAWALAILWATMIAAGIFAGLVA